MKWLRGAIVVPFVLASCADPEHMADYYDLESERTAALIASIERQAQAKSSQQVAMMQSYSTAISSAATTPSAADDVAVALAWGFMLGSEDDIVMPNLPPIKAPPTDVDYIRAWSPIISSLVPFLYPLAYGWADGGGASYTATDQGQINISSKNAGAYNSAGGDQSITASTESCVGCDTDGETPVNLPALGDPDFDLPSCLSNPPAGFSSPSNTPLYTEGCSCTSFANGRC